MELCQATPSYTGEAVIPSWTAEDYLNTTKPFEWLYAQRENKFVMAQNIERVKQNAGAVGVKNFMALWRAYHEVIKAQNGCFPPDNVTEFSDQPLELYCGKFTCDDDGITYLNSYGAEVIVCQHPIIPIRRLINIDSNRVKIELAYKRGGGQWKTLIVDKGMLASSQKILELSEYGVSVDSKNALELVAYLTELENQNYEKLGETLCVGRLGWIKKDLFSPYSENLEFDGDIFFSHIFRTLKTSGSRDIWFDYVREVRKSRSIANLQFAASFASPLIEPLGKLPFFVHLWGGSETGKTVGMLMAASVWANPTIGEYIKTFSSTTVGMEQMAGFVNSLPLCIDELQIAKERKDFDRDIYTLTEGVGKMRGSKYGGLQKTLTWKNCILTCGEMPITNSNSGGGAVNRVIEIDCSGKKLFPNLQYASDLFKENYGFVGSEYIGMVSKNAREVRETYAKVYTQLEKCNKAEKQIMAAALILTADELIDRWIFHDGQRLTVDEIDKFLKTKSEIDVNLRAFEYLKDVINSSPARFKVTDNNGELWGEIGDDAIYIIKSIFDRIMNEQSFNTSAFLSWAKREKILDCEDGRFTKKKRIRGTNITARCVVLFNNDWVEVKTDNDLDF